MNRISVVIRCYNEAAHIGKILAGLRQQTCKPDEVIVVDSGSTDTTVAIAARLGASVLTISPQEFTFGRSLNVGCRAATGDVIVIASAHVYPPHETWIESLTAPFEDSEVGLTYGRQVGDHSTRFSEEQLLNRWFPAQSVAHQPHPFCNNANAAVRRNLWQSLPYNEELTGLEDLDWALRALQAGFQIAYVAEATVAHVHRERFSQVLNRYQREAIAHKQIFPEQRMSRLDAFRFAAANIASDYLHAMLKGRLLPNLLDIPSFRIAEFVGSYQGFRHQGPIAATLLRHFYYPPALNSTGAKLESDGNGQPIRYEDSSERHAA